MNRFAWYDGKTDPNERTLGSQTNVRLYDGEEKVCWNFSTRQLPRVLSRETRVNFITEAIFYWICKRMIHFLANKTFSKFCQTKGGSMSAATSKMEQS